MTRTIELTPKWTKWIYIFNGTVNTGIGIRILTQADSWIHWASIVAIILVLAGPLLIVYGIMLFNSVSKQVPKVTVDENGVYIKADVLKKQLLIDWANVKEIRYKAFELNFLLTNNEIEIVNLPTSPGKSIEVKKAIREFAGGAHINIIGG